MNNLPNTQLSSNDNSEITIDIRQLLSKLLDKWTWFVLGVMICFLTAFLYLRYASPVYKINAKLLVNDQNKGGGLGSKVSGLMDLGSLMESNNSVENEIEILKTRFLMEQVVRDMQLNIVYSSKGKVVSSEIYDPPFQLLLLKGKDTLTTTTLEIHPLEGDKVKVIGIDYEKTFSWGQKFELKGLGLVQLNKVSNLDLNKKDYLVTVHNIDSRVASLMSQLSVTPVNKQVSIIDLGMTYPIPKKGEDILNKLIAKYIAANLNDKNSIADSTGKFIKE
ncbi:MAG: Wzz/FepE/Etk N-terminal domain-containing protein, partial [Bacteroidia bacterium]